MDNYNENEIEIQGGRILVVNCSVRLGILWKKIKGHFVRSEPFLNIGLC